MCGQLARFASGDYRQRVGGFEPLLVSTTLHLTVARYLRGTLHRVKSLDTEVSDGGIGNVQGATRVDLTDLEFIVRTCQNKTGQKKFVLFSAAGTNMYHRITLLMFDVDCKQGLTLCWVSSHTKKGNQTLEHHRSFRKTDNTRSSHGLDELSS